MPSHLCLAALRLSVRGRQVSSQMLNYDGPGQHLRPLFGNGNGVLGMRTGLAIQRYNCPVVRQDFRAMTAHIDHRLNRKNVANLYFWPEPRLPVIRDLGIFMHSPTDSMANVVADNGIAMPLSMLLDRPSDISKVIACSTLHNGSLETL